MKPGLATGTEILWKGFSLAENPSTIHFSTRTSPAILRNSPGPASEVPRESEQ